MSTPESNPGGEFVLFQTRDERLQNIFEEGELAEDSVIRKFRITAADGENYKRKEEGMTRAEANNFSVHVFAVRVDGRTGAPQYSSSKPAVPLPPPCGTHNSAGLLFFGEEMA